MVSEPILCRRCARSAASATGCWGASLRTTACLVGSPALGETARDVAKDLPIRLLHGGGHAAWLEAHGLAGWLADGRKESLAVFVRQCSR